MKSVMTPQQHFAQIASPRIKRSTFDRSHGYKTTFDAGKLIPIFVDEALPGDTFNLNTAVFARLNTPIKPIMDNLYLDIHYFSVPNRLVWQNWQRMNGEQDNPDDTTDYVMPTITAPVGGFTEGSIYDYLGVPTKVAGLEIRADFLRAINLIWNQWYRDQNLQNSVTINLDDGPDASTDYDILPRGKRKDYFTSALPWAQKGDPVSIPLGTSAPVLGLGKFNQNYDNLAATVYESDGTTSTYARGKLISDSNVNEYLYVQENGTTGYPNIRADLSSATAATINALREASQVQVMLELDARGGTRYIELLKVHFGVTSPDARLQRPEFLGGFTTPINISPIAQTSTPTNLGPTPQGNLAAMGTASNTAKGFVKSFVEHEIIIGFASVRADLNYQQGLNRMWSRSTRFDFFWPSLANLGEQAILNKEIYAQGTSADENVFGYQERYAEYRYKPSQVTSRFRSNDSLSIDIWHLAQDFSALPTLSAAFIQEDPPVDRVVAIPAEPHMIMDMYFDLKCTRPMPTYATPGSLVHI